MTKLPTDRKKSPYWWQDKQGKWHYDASGNDGKKVTKPGRGTKYPMVTQPIRPGDKPQTVTEGRPTTTTSPTPTRKNYDASGTYTGKPKFGGVTYSGRWANKGKGKRNMKPSKKLSAAAQRRADKKGEVSSNRGGLVDDKLLANARDRMIRKRRRK